MSVLQYFLNKRANFFCTLLLTLILVCSGKAKAQEKPTISPERETPQFQANNGSFFWQRGKFARAIAAWSKEAELYKIQGSKNLQARAILKISQGYQQLGQFELSIHQLKKVLTLASEPSLIARTWKQLGNSYSRSGKFSEAIEAYKKSLEIEESLSTVNNLVILLRKKNLRAKLQANSSRVGDQTESYQREGKFYEDKALSFAKLALSLSKTKQSSSSVRALIEWHKVTGQELGASQLDFGRNILEKLPSERTKVFLAINWAKLDPSRAKYWLSIAQQIAENIGDAGAESYALLELGVLYEHLEREELALKYASAAQLKAQFKFAFGSLYRAHWLAGRIYKRNGNREAAMNNYCNAIASLDAFNQGVTNLNIERRIDFNSKIEPIYREMLELLLDDSALNESNLEEAIFVFDKLRLAELQNYFGDNCFEIDRESLPIFDILAKNNMALINSIILDDFTHFILQLPHGKLLHSKVELGKAEITKMATTWNKNLQQANTRRFILQSRNFYDIILRPFEKELTKFNPSTVIFVHDGILRNLPMAALNDGEKFLAQKWATASSIGLNFVSNANGSKKFLAVAFGLGVKRGDWDRLPHVSQEVKDVIDIVGGRKFLNQEFTSENFAAQLQQERYPIVHLATHGYFGGTAENSFILAYDREISALELKDILTHSREAIELLVLSACETAISSERSALGLAGVALRSGINSVLGSFWQVFDDEQAELIRDFYSYTQNQNLGLAQALQQIQIHQISLEAHPSKWAALNLIEKYVLEPD